MKTINIIVLFFFLILLMSCSPPIKVMTDYDSQYDYTSLKTFKWILVETPPSISELRVKRFMIAINSELEAKGFVQSNEDPDFFIAGHGMTETKIAMTDWGYGPGPYRRWGSYEFDIDTYEEGTILLDFVDSNSEELFWRGIGTRVTVEPNLSENEQVEKYERIANELLKEFPPTK